MRGSRSNLFREQEVILPLTTTTIARPATLLDQVDEEAKLRQNEIWISSFCVTSKNYV